MKGSPLLRRKPFDAATRRQVLRMYEKEKIDPAEIASALRLRQSTVNMILASKNLPDILQIDALSTVLKTIAPDPHLQILLLLSRAPARGISKDTLQAKLKTTAPAVSRYLDKLKDQGLVTIGESPNYYSLVSHPVVEAVLGTLVSKDLTDILRIDKLSKVLTAIAPSRHIQILLLLSRAPARGISKDTLQAKLNRLNRVNRLNTTALSVSRSIGELIYQDLVMPGEGFNYRLISRRPVVEAVLGTLRKDDKAAASSERDDSDEGDEV